MPKVTPLPQISHFAICLHLLLGIGKVNIGILSDIREKSKPFLKF